MSQYLFNLPINLIKTFLKNKYLVYRLIKRDIANKYIGSFLGIFWTSINPFLMLGLYTFVFSVVYQTRWGINTSDSKASFSLVLFSGLIIHLFFTEVLNNSYCLVISNVNYVKKVVFPLEILTLVCVGSALFQFLISFLVLFFAIFILNGIPPLGIIFVPLTFLPLLPLTLGTSWFLSALGVYVRDIGQILGLLTTVILFMSPVFYPSSSLPPLFRNLIKLNPITVPIEQFRNSLIFGRSINWFELFLYTIMSVIFAIIGLYFFQKTKKGFSDVI